MSEKHDLAGYMASLLTLLEHQDKAGVHGRSQQLGREFDRGWEKLKEIITKEEEHARQSEQQRERTKNAAANERGESGRGGPDRLGSDETERGSAVERPGTGRATDDIFHSPRR